MTDPRSGFATATAGLETARRVGDRRFGSELIGHAASNAIRTGEWDWAVRELTRLLAEELDPADRAFPIAVSLEISAARGEDSTAEVKELERIAHGDTDPQVLWALDTAHGWAAFGRGDLIEASGQWASASGRFGTRAAASLRWAMHALVWQRDEARALDLFDRFQSLGAHGPGLEAQRETMRAGVEALTGSVDEALRTYANALAAWRDLGLPWDAALTALDMTAGLDHSIPAVRHAADEATEILERFRARVLLARLTAAQPARASVRTESMPAR